MSQQIFTNYVQIPFYQEGVQERLEALGAKHNSVCTESSVNYMIFESLNQLDLRGFNMAINADPTTYFNARANLSHSYNSRDEIQPNYLKMMVQRLTAHYSVA